MADTLYGMTNTCMHKRSGDCLSIHHILGERAGKDTFHINEYNAMQGQ